MDFDYTHCNAITNCEIMQAHFKKRSAGFGSPKQLLRQEPRNRQWVSGSHRLCLQFFGGSDGRAQALPVLARAARSSNPFEPPPPFGSEGVGCSKTAVLGGHHG